MYIDVSLKNKSKMTNQLYTYESDEDLEVGTRVIVPFGKGNVSKMGLVVRTYDKLEKDIETKKVISILDSEALVPKESIDIAFFMVDKYLSDYSSAFQTVLPPGNFEELKETFISDESLSCIDKRLYDFLKDEKTYDEIKEVFSITYTRLKELSDKGYIKNKIAYDTKISHKYVTYVDLIERDSYDIRENAHAQKKVLSYLKEKNTEEYKKLLSRTGVTSSTIKSLEKKFIVRLRKEIEDRQVHEAVPTYKKIKLNDQQEKAYKAILSNQKTLLHGVTGSGKTEIYLQLVEKMLKEGKDSIILVPEISLTPQTIARFEGRFPGKVAVYHSKLSVNEKFEQFIKIKNGEYKLVVGARSAIFSPFENLGLIVIDEEHESSYVSEKNPKYNAIEVAEYRAAYNKAKLVLGSATPRVEDYYKAKNGEYELAVMDERTNGKAPKDAIIVDMREELSSGNTSMFSKVLYSKIKENLENKHQTILFLNKRGHTSFVFCRRCGYSVKCDSCDVAMTYHKTKDTMICHMCGRTQKKPKICPNCGSKAIKEFGAGTQKLEEEARELFPQARIFRMDRDNVNRLSDYNYVYDKMKNQEIDILIGTQMLSKGFDFPNVSLVGIMAADISLNMGNYSANEKTFQLLTQVSGRAGRGELDGEVVIQTYKPGNFAIVNSSKYDYESFYEKEIGLRKAFNYPPFYRILNINISNKNRELAAKKIMEISSYINALIRKYKLSKTLVIGPHPSPIERINKMYRFDIYYKFPHNEEKIIDIVKEVINENRFNLNFAGFTIKVILDPQSYF
ncbi:MAG: primosomal protein N' [Finegoldia sp.]|nr:primosomal protein N' [Finegoldia sp.]